MMARQICTCFILGAVLVAGRSAWAAVSDAEDLTGCKLPNGRAVMPIAGTPQAVNGALLKIGSNTMVVTPMDAGKALSPDQTVDAMRKSQAADAQFLPNSDGSLWVFSGFVTDVGAGHLADYSGKKLDEAGPIKKTSRNYAAGQFPGVSEGFVYLLKTTDGKWALLRVLEKTDAAMIVQFVEQPDGSTTFDIPRNKTLTYQRPLNAEVLGAEATATAPGTQIAAGPAEGAGVLGGGVGTTGAAISDSPLSPAAPMGVTPTAARLATSMPAPSRIELGPGDHVEPGVIVLVAGAKRDDGAATDPALDGFATQRWQMIQNRLNLITTTARTTGDIDRKAQAINDLITLHADEPAVAEALVGEISFFNPRSTANEISRDALHPAFAALKHMGKSASMAALKGLRRLDLEGAGDGIDSPAYKVRLLGMVIRTVEGDEAADFLLKREAEKEPDPKRRAVFEFLLSNK